MSLDIALSGINAVSSSLEIISNNIANSSTLGFKSSRANFSAVYAGNVANGSQVTSETQSIAKGGGVMNTGRSMDAVIQSGGFFAVKEQSGQQVYTRVGSFNVDKDGFVVDTSGRKVQGYAALTDAAGKPLPGAGLGPLGDLKVPTGQISAQATDKLKFNGNLSSDWTTPTKAFDSNDPTSFSSSITSVIYDSLGAQHSVTQYFVKTGTSNVAVYFGFGNEQVVDSSLAAANPGATSKTAPDVSLSFDGMGQLASMVPATPTLPAVTPAGAAPLNVAIDYTGTTQFSGDTTTLANEPNGYAAGTLTGTTMAEDGGVIATYSNGKTQKVGTVALATFANQNALKAVDNTSWAANADTGTALLAAPGTAAASKLSIGSLEQSNVDMTGELVDLMSAQRNYQANTKVISAVSEMMQSLMQAI